MISVFGYVIRESPKAVLFLWDFTRRPVWLPKSQIVRMDWGWGDTLKIPLWLADKHMIQAVPTPIEAVWLKGENDYGNGVQNL